MKNKRLFIFVVMIFSVLVFSGLGSADWDVKVNWNGNAFDWASAGCFANDGNSEKGCLSYSGDPNLYLKYCGSGNTPSGYSEVGTSHSGAYYVSLNPAYNYNYWRFGECNNRHQVGKHFENRAHWDRNNPGLTSGGRYAYVTCSDTDGDSYASSVSSWASSINVCGNTESAACDRDSSTKGIYSSTTEVCDGFDNDCDGSTDEGNVCLVPCTGTSCEPGNTGRRCVNNFWTDVSSTTETCDDLDNNCDGHIDEGIPKVPCYYDFDGDDFGKPSWQHPTAWDCSYASNIDGCPSSYVDITGDCDDTNINIYPGAPELCDGVDNQCPQDSASIDENNGHCNLPDLCISGTCDTPKAYWASDFTGNTKIDLPTIRDADVGDEFYLVLKNPPSTDKKWKFEIFENDLIGEDNIRTTADENELFGVLTNGKIIAKWIITQADIDNAGAGRDKFYFIATKTTTTYTAPQQPSSPISGLITGLPTTPSEQEIDQEFFPQTHTFTSDSFLELEWPDEPSEPSDGDDFCDSITICSDYAEETKCNLNTCELTINIENVDCDDNPDLIECGCGWATNECGESWKDNTIDDVTGDPVNGHCYLGQEIISNCEEDGILQYSYDLAWIWDDPDTPSTTVLALQQKAECLEIENPSPIVCPAQVQLPLTNWFSIIAIVIIITLGYVLFSRDNKISPKRVSFGEK